MRERIPEPLLLAPEDKDEIAQLIRESLADVAAGHVVDDDIIEAWIDSLDTENPLPVPHSDRELNT